MINYKKTRIFILVFFIILIWKGCDLMIYNKGINDMPKLWRKENREIYNCWYNMIRRCYDKKLHKRIPTYARYYVCERWLKLSNFVEDLPYIDNYGLWLENKKNYELDKDIKSNGKNRCYCLKECMFVTKKENVKQSNKTMSYDFMRGKNNPNHNGHTEEAKKKMSESKKGKYKKENHPRSKKVIQYSKNGEVIKIWECIKTASEDLNIADGSISSCCRGKLKTAGGYIWRYYENNEVNEVIE